MDPVIPEVDHWLESRGNGIEQLKVLVAELDKCHKGSNITKILGAVAAIGGTLAGLGGLVLTPVSGGASLVPGVIAFSAGVSGTGAAFAGNKVKQVLTEKKLKKVQNIFEEDRRCTEMVSELVKYVEEVECIITEHLEHLIKAKLQELGIDTYKEDNSDPGKAADSVPLKINNLKIRPNKKPKLDRYFDSVKTIGSLGAHVKKGIKVAKQLDLFDMNKVMKLGRAVISPIKEKLPQLGARLGSDTGAVFRAGTQALQLGKIVRYGGVVISVALLPVDVYTLVKTSLELHRNDGHEASKLIEQQILELETQMRHVKEFLYRKLKDINNFVLLMNNILCEGCDENIGSLVTQILKRLLPLQKWVKAFDSIDTERHPPFQDNRKPSILSAILVNCEGLEDSLYKRLSTFIWCAWRMGNGTVIFLQNTIDLEDLTLLTLFGVSVSSLNLDKRHGVSILLPFEFPGDILSITKYYSNDSDWNGRCLVVNVTYQEELLSLISLLAPQSKLSCDLFMKEMSVFIRQNAVGKILLGANFLCELQTMTVIVRCRVSRNVPFTLIRSLIPFREVTEYLIQKPHQSYIPTLMTYQMMKKFPLMNADDIDIFWNYCSGTQVSTDNYRDQLKPITDIGLSGLWGRKSRDCMEFSMEKEVSERVVNCLQNLEFFVSPELVKKIEDCSLDHTLRFLGFLKQSVLVMRVSGEV